MKSRRTMSGLTRAEAGAQARRRRAMAHLERVRNQREQRGPSLRAAAWAVAAVSLVAGLLASGGGAAPVANVWVLGAHWVSSEEIAATAGLAPGIAPATIDRAALVAQLAEHAWIDSARVLLLPGGVLLVGVTEREPAAVLEGETPWAVDTEGVAFAPAPAAGIEQLLVVTAAERPETGAPDADLAQAVALARSLPELGLPTPERVLIAAPDDPEGLSLVLPGVAARIVLGRDDLDARLADLARLLDAGLPELEGASRIDLRFEDQAVLDMDPSLEGAEQAAAKRGGASPSNSRRAG